MTEEAAYYKIIDAATSRATSSFATALADT
jgi:hypothetical protein